MNFLSEILTSGKKTIAVYAFHGPSGTGKSFRAKLVAQQYGIRAIIDDGLLIYEDDIAAGHSAKLESSYMGAVRVALFDDKAHRDEVALKIRKLHLKKILILGTSEKMVMKIAMRLQLPPPEKYIRIEDIASAEQIAEAQRSRLIEGKHVIPVRANAVKSRNYSKIFVDYIRVSLAKRGFFRRFIGQKSPEPNASTKLFEKSVVRPAFSRTERKFISSATLARLTTTQITDFNRDIRVKRLSIRTAQNGYRFVLTVDIPFCQQLTNTTNALKSHVISNIERSSGILVEDISIIVDKILQPANASALGLA
ncbi:MAG: AAA family ATPase [Treponema sp.]|nr:AAA family ATPase [Treponema sp.]